MFLISLGELPWNMGQIESFGKIGDRNYQSINGLVGPKHGVPKKVDSNL